MTLPERYGKFVLVKELDFGSLGFDYRALEIPAEGKPQPVNLLKINETLTRDEAGLRRLVTEAKASAQLASPNILKILAIGKVGESYFISYPLLEAQMLKSVFRKSRRENFPLAPDHALLIASKMARALEYCHSRKFEGSRYFHGSLYPSSVFITYDGEVRIRGFAFWNALRDKARLQGHWGAEESLYLAPEQTDSFEGDYRSDLFTLGAILFEMLTGLPYFEKDRTVDYPGRIMAARAQHPPGEGAPLSLALIDLLRLLLAPKPADRLPEVGEARQRMDELLFTGEFQPTTFNLAFFMHSLFRKEIDEDAKTQRAELDRDYRSLFGEPSAHSPRGSGTAVQEESSAKSREALHRSDPAIRTSAARPSGSIPRTEAPSPALVSAARASGDAHVEVVPANEGGLAPPVSATGPLTVRSSPSGSGWRLLATTAILVLAAATGWLGFRYLKPGLAAPEAATAAAMIPADKPATVDYQAEIRRIQEELLKAKEAELTAERERLRLEVRKEFEGKQESLIAAEIKRREKDVEDRLKAHQEQELKRREEELAVRARLQEAEKRTAPEEPAEPKELSPRRLEGGIPTQQEEIPPAAAETAPPVVGATTAPREAPLPQIPSVVVGQLASAEDPLVVPPRPKKRVLPEYPPLAARQRVQGEVVVSALVSETGDVLDVRLVQGRKSNLGFDEAAIKAVIQYKFYPPTKNGVPVRVWFNVVVKFRI